MEKVEVAVHITPEDIAQADDIDFEEVSENWNTYKLKDGTTLKVKFRGMGYLLKCKGKIDEGL